MQARHPDLVLLDVMLPGRDGLQVCRDLRGFSDVPIIMLTARADEADRLAGLEGGADDYICKTPFSPREIVARVKAILRRSRRAQADVASDEKGAVSTLHIDAAAYRASFHGVALELTPVEFRLLRSLAAVPGQVLSREVLLNKLHDDRRAVTDRTSRTCAASWSRRRRAASPSGPSMAWAFGWSCSGRAAGPCRPGCKNSSKKCL